MCYPTPSKRARLLVDVPDHFHTRASLPSTCCTDNSFDSVNRLSLGVTTRLALFHRSMTPRFNSL
ncbi:hypothetical protein OG21DRAFT_1507456 [Imleria badia]|nr:hypothetical protein OG21DRAFT_1507456 [Imleria badia]